MGSMDVAVYLLENGAAVDEAVSSTQETPLSIAAYYREIDILRMLLSRGASLDHFDAHGFSAVAKCMYGVLDEQPKAAAVDMLKVINEFALLDTNIDGGGEKHLHGAALFSSASEIDFLISLGWKVEDRDRDGRTALSYAALGGNPVTYFALLAHGSTTAYLTDNLLLVIYAKAKSFHRVNKLSHESLFDPIIKDLLSRRVDLMTSIYVVDERPQDIQGPPIPLQQAAAVYGPEIEAWFLGILQECGLESGEDRRRLQELRTGGYDQHGVVIGEVDEESDHDSGDEDPEYAGSESGRSSAGSEAEDTEDDECFWDAEEGA
jgi:hypothetical protein